MNRFVTILSLALGVSVASYAGVISSSAGLSGSATLIDFENSGTFPLGAFSSLPFTIAGQAVTISSSCPSPCSGTKDTGTQAAIGTGAASYFTPGTLAGRYITTYSGGDFGQNASTSYVRTITFTFGGAGVSGFLTDYFANDSTANYFQVNGLATQYSLTSQPCVAGAPTCPNNGLSTGFVADGAVPVINSISFTFTGSDSAAAFGGDQVLFDNVRFTTGSPVSSSSSSSSSSTSVSGVPEPSTYALIGAGLALIASRRRKS